MIVDQPTIEQQTDHVRIARSEIEPTGMIPRSLLLEELLPKRQTLCKEKEPVVKARGFGEDWQQAIRLERSLL
jgi:hypothetical protein